MSYPNRINAAIMPDAFPNMRFLSRRRCSGDGAIPGPVTRAKNQEACATDGASRQPGRDGRRETRGAAGERAHVPVSAGSGVAKG